MPYTPNRDNDTEFKWDRTGNVVHNASDYIVISCCVIFIKMEILVENMKMLTRNMHMVKHLNFKTTSVYTV